MHINNQPYMQEPSARRGVTQPCTSSNSFQTTYQPAECAPRAKGVLTTAWFACVCAAPRLPYAVQLPALLESLSRLHCPGCESLKQLPALAHTAITELTCSHCSLLQDLPDMPDSLKQLRAYGLTRVTRLPRLPRQSMHLLCIAETSVSQLTGLPSRVDALRCNGTRIQRLPALESCRSLELADCVHLQQLPEQLPADLCELNCRECSSLQQLPEQLPTGLTSLDCSGCSALKRLPALLPATLERLEVSNCIALEQLPELPATMKVLRCEDCYSRQLPDMSNCGARVYS